MDGKISRCGDELFIGGGAMGARMRAYDWGATALGDCETWAQPLRLTIPLMLGSQFPTLIAWGSDLTCLYNDRFAEFIGIKHPSALGRSLPEIFSGIWPEIAPLVQRALGGDAVYRANRRLIVFRNGCEEEAYFTFSLSPVRDESGGTNGILFVCTETTAAVMAERHMSSMLSSIADCVLVVDRDWQVTHVTQRSPSRVWREHFGLSAGAGLLEGLPEETRKVFDYHCRLAMEGQAPVSFELVIRPTGLWVKVHAYPKAAALTLFLRDITARYGAAAGQATGPQARMRPEPRQQDQDSGEIEAIAAALAEPAGFMVHHSEGRAAAPASQRRRDRAQIATAALHRHRGGEALAGV